MDGLSSGFQEILRKQPVETLVTNGETQRIWAKEERPSYQAFLDENKRILDPHAVEHAKTKEFLPPFLVRILGNTQDLTVDETTTFEKQVVIEGLRGQDSILSLKEKLIKEGAIDGNPRIFLLPHELQDETLLGECYVQWSGFGLDSWPPKFVVMQELKGFEIVVTVPAMDSAVWEIVKGSRRLKKYCTRRLVFDLMPDTTVEELKRLLEQKLGISSAKQLLSAEVDGSFFGAAGNYFIDLDDDALSMKDYGIDRFGYIIHFRVNRFDSNGNFDFDNVNFLEGCQIDSH